VVVTRNKKMMMHKTRSAALYKIGRIIMHTVINIMSSDCNPWHRGRFSKPEIPGLKNGPGIGIPNHQPVLPIAVQ